MDLSYTKTTTSISDDRLKSSF